MDPELGGTQEHIRFINLSGTIDIWVWVILRASKGP